jgi:hypothetical protein
MKHILVKAGERQPSAFSDLKELVNYEEGPQVGFFSLFKPGLRLIRNRTVDNTDCAFAIAHFVVDPLGSRQHPLYFKPLDVKMLMNAADRYDYVMAGMTTKTHLPSEEQTLLNMQYIARATDGNLVNAETGERLKDNIRVTFLTAIFGFVRVKGFPIYHMILNTDLIHASDGFDYYDTSEDTKWMLLSDFDGTAVNHIFSMETSPNATIVGSTIVTTGPEFRLNPLGQPRNVMRNENLSQILAASDYTITSGLDYVVENGEFVIKTPRAGSVDTFELKFNCGHFFDIAHPSERPTFKYVVLRSI